MSTKQQICYLQILKFGPVLQDSRKSKFCLHFSSSLPCTENTDLGQFRLRMTTGNLWFNFLLKEESVMISHHAAQDFNWSLKTSEYQVCMAFADNLLFSLTTLKDKQILLPSSLTLFFCNRYYKMQYNFQNSVLHLHIHDVIADRIC